MRLYMIKKMAPYLVLAVFFLILDRLAKVLFHVYLSDRSFYILDNILSLRLATNEYIAFSIPLSGVILEILIALVIVLLLIAFINFVKHTIIFLQPQ